LQIAVRPTKQRSTASRPPGTRAIGAADAWKSDARRAADAEIADAPPLAQDERESAPEAGAS
jgi:hypothetical protein